jgi:hypothetical protein
MAAPEARLWTNLRKALPKQAAAFRIENRAGPGMPDVAAVFDSVTCWIELKAPKSRPKLHVAESCERLHIFRFDQETWEIMHKNDVPSQKLMETAPVDKISLSYCEPTYVRSTQSAWHARVFGVGGLSFFLEKTPGPSSYRLFSPCIAQEPGTDAQKSCTLRLGLVCETRDLGLIWYALRACAEMHSLAAISGVYGPRSVDHGS